MLTAERLLEVTTLLARRPGHEMVRANVYALLVEGLEVSVDAVEFERPIKEVRGRVDALLGRTVFEFKSDLRRETADAEEELGRYLPQRERDTGEHYVGIATDGANFVPYEMRDGHLRRLSPFVNDPRAGRAVLEWLSSAVCVSAELEPTPQVVTRELGRGSLAWQVAERDIRGLWVEIGHRPDVVLKRDLWSRLLERVYGSPVEDDALFFQHTYLSIIAKTMATHVLGMDVPEPSELLSGRPFQEAGIGGVVEADFFDWILGAEGGVRFVRKLALQAGRFRLQAVQTDVLKGLYESLVDPAQRHDLGEYYTPDWLAARICERAITRPLEQRVLDPACGSGTFVFHALRRFLAAAEANHTPIPEALGRACERIFGVDVHPVAVQIARVTYLLAVGADRLRQRPAHLAIPVYLGDSLQWNTRGFLADREVLIEVPGGGPLLEFPLEVARDPGRFDEVIGRMLALSAEEPQAAPEALVAWINREYPMSAGAIEALARTYQALADLRRAGRDHIWGFVARNLVRPVWLSQEDQKADVIVGNPPWLSYRFMTRQTQEQFREESRRRGLWTGGRVATHQDLSGYFFARSVELYLRAGGTIAFVMPFAAMTRKQFDGLRSGVFVLRRGRRVIEAHGRVQFLEAWAFRDDVQPLFPVPSCVLIAEATEREGHTLPDRVSYAEGVLPHRNATSEEAQRRLRWSDGPWPEITDDDAPASPYRELFVDGATLYPRLLCIVERAPAGPLGGNEVVPLVTSRRTAQEKRPWKDLPPLRQTVEAQFVRPVLLGESIAPYRTIEPLLAVIPWDEQEQRLMDAAGARRAGYLHLSRWMADAERVWHDFGRGGTSFLEQIDYFGKLSAQLPVRPIRVVYSKAGTLQAAAVIRGRDQLVDHKLYWYPCGSESEGSYLAAILNSEVARSRVQHLQSLGQWGARDFDKVMLSLPIPLFDATLDLHARLANAAQRAEVVARDITWDEGTHFTRIRRAIREALIEDGLGEEIEGLVRRLLG